MSFEVTRLRELIEESRDQQRDTMHDARQSVADLRDVASDRDHEEVDPAETAEFADARTSLVARLGLDDGGFARTGALAGGLGAALAAVLAQPAVAGTATDIQILQTASSLEVLAVATYGAALTLPFIKDGNAVVVKFAQTTMSQHDEHRQAFQAQTRALGGKKQTKANPKYAPVVESAKPQLASPLDVVSLAATLEQVATETYLSDLSLIKNTRSKALMASVMGVESQHLAVLRAVRALLAGGAPQLIAIPTDVAALPAAAGSVAFPDAFAGTSMASPPQEGALR